mmetsp:Transcript_34835/g.78719  ORF Transcript_34835/g.78719 Transcript_34835/m.78719 type:complete len:123 (-) Transcript_34835:1055-1423(-)
MSGLDGVSFYQEALGSNPGGGGSESPPRGSTREEIEDGGGGRETADAVVEAGQSEQSEPERQQSVVVKVGMVGDMRVGKTTLMVKYVEGRLDEDYIQVRVPRIFREWYRARRPSWSSTSRAA